MNQLAIDRYSEEQVMMTLSAIAYIPFESIANLQDSLNAAEALEKAYTAIWWVKDDSSLLYVVKNRATGDYAIAVKGPVFRLGLSLLLNLYEDLDMAHQVSLPYSRLGNAKIAAGILDILHGINDLSYNGRTLNQLINNLPDRTKLYITGHSLGGTLAAAFAAKLSCSNLVDLNIIPYTFGAPAAGNDLFADLFDPVSVNYLFTQSFRCVNNLDIIPYTWHDLQGIPSINYGNIKCPLELTLCVDCVERLLILSRVFYVQLPLTSELKSEIELNDGFFREAMYQHRHNTYLSLLGLSPINSAEYSYKERRDMMLADSL